MARRSSARSPQEVISEATIRGVFGNQFNITGLSPGEARDLALLMRSGSWPQRCRSSTSA